VTSVSLKTNLAALMACALCVSAQADNLTLTYADTYSPRIAYAFGARSQLDRYNMQILGYGTHYVLDTLNSQFAGYDTTAVFNAVARKDGQCLVTKLDRIVTQMYVFDTEPLLAMISKDSIDSIKVAWKGSVTDFQGDSTYLLFKVPQAGHVFGAYRGRSSCSYDTVTPHSVLPTQWLTSFLSTEIAILLEMSQGTTSADTLQIQTDYFALLLTLKNGTTIALPGDSRRAVATAEHRILTVSRTQCTYTLGAPSAVDVRLYTLQGMLVRRAVQGRQPAGAHTIYWDLAGGGFAAANCVVRLTAGGVAQSRRLVDLPR
jgi:hypothetical protein